MAKKLLKDASFFDEGDIIDRIANEQEELKKEENSFDLTSLVDFYHKSLFNNNEVIDYLNKKGIKNQEIISRFKIGYADGNLQSLLSKKQTEELQKLNIIDKDGEEALLDNIIIPQLDINDNVVDIYGINIVDDSAKSIFNTKSIFNIKAIKVYDEVILTDSIINCLSLIGSGFENAVAVKDKAYIIEENINILKDNRVKTIITTGGNDSTKELLINKGFGVKSISLPEQMGKKEITTLMDQAELIKLKDNKKDSFKVSSEDNVYTFNINDITYKITGVKEIFVTNLRVHIKVEYEGESEHDNLDLYSARSRNSFSNNISKKLNIDTIIVDKDLNKILDYLERERNKKFGTEEEQKELSQQEKEIGLRFLKNKEMFKEIIDDMSLLGYVGEDLNKLLLYICARSRKLDDPISVLIVSESSSGKSYLVDTVKRLIPSDDVVAVTSMSDQALNYAVSLLHKFLVFGEAVHSDTIEYQIREMLSSKELTRLVTVKDEKTGKMVSELIKKKVVVASTMSTTSHNLNPENASRYFLINADESKEQTKRIHDAQRSKYTLEREHIKSDVIPEIIQKHHAAQRLLKKVIIVNDFAKHLDFPDATMRTRRDHNRFIDLIAGVCFLRQYQKEIKNNGKFNYIECDLTDYETAYEIMIRGVLKTTMIDIPRAVINLYEEIRVMAARMASDKNLTCEEVVFIQRDVREFTRLSGDTIRTYIRVLVEYEYLLIISGRNKGLRNYYKLRKDESMENIDLTIIPTPDNIKTKTTKTTKS